MRNLTLAMVVLVTGAAVAQGKQEKKFEITPAIQQQLDQWKETASKWAADPLIVKAVVEQNGKGPIAKMDEKAWKALRRRSPEVEAFQTNDAGKLLAAKQKDSAGIVSEAFLCASKGEKAAFIEKTTYYLHAGKPKFDVPFQKLVTWQGQPEFDESSQTYAIQITVPVKESADKKQAIGVLVVGLNLTSLSSPAPGK